MPTGQGRPFYQWSRAVQIRTNLDLVLDWLQGAGLGDIATEFFRKLSMAVNLLCVPRTSLLKVTAGQLYLTQPLTPQPSSATFCIQLTVGAPLEPHAIPSSDTVGNTLAGRRKPAPTMTKLGCV